MTSTKFVQIISQGPKILSKVECVLPKDTTLCRPATPQSQVKHFTIEPLLSQYSETCFKQPLKRSKMVFKTDYRLMQAKHIAEYSAILSTFIKLPLVIKIFVLSFFSGRLRHVLLYTHFYNTHWVQDNSAQNQLGPCQLGPHKTGPCQLGPRCKTGPNLSFINIQLVPHFRGIEVCECKIRPFTLSSESSILTRLRILNFIMVDSADTNKRPRCYKVLPH